MPAELLRINAHAPEIDALRYAAHFLTRGCVVGIPTDTFYGLAADPFNLAAVDEIYRVKGRPETRALPILVNSLEQALMLVRDREGEIGGVNTAPGNFLRLVEAFWPGGLTLVMDASNRVPLKVSAYIYAEQVFIAWACAGVVASPTLQRRVAFRIALRLR